MHTPLLRPYNPKQNACKQKPNHPCRKKRSKKADHCYSSLITPPSISPPLRSMWSIWSILMLDLVVSSHNTGVTRRSTVTSSRARTGRALLLLLLGASVSSSPTGLCPVFSRSRNRVHYSIVLLRATRTVTIPRPSGSAVAAVFAVADYHVFATVRVGVFRDDVPSMKKTGEL